MEDNCIYQVEVRGQVSLSDLISFGPPGLAVECTEDLSTLTFQTDQSGLIGFIRHLHGYGFTLLSIHAHFSKIENNLMNRST
jgi:hypothetical protein